MNDDMQTFDRFIVDQIYEKTEVVDSTLLSGYCNNPIHKSYSIHTKKKV